MKSVKIFQSFLIICSVVVLGGFAAFLSSCDGSEPESPSEIASKKLTASPWKVISVTVDGVDKTALFTGFTISFLNLSYQSANGGEVWRLTPGNWNLDASGTFFTRGDGIQVQLSTLTETSLVMSLNWNKNTFGPGRSLSISGQHVFTMGK